MFSWLKNALRRQAKPVPGVQLANQGVANFAAAPDMSQDSLLRNGRTAASDGRVIDALGHLRLAVTQRPTDAAARVALGFALLEQALYAEARPHLNRGILLDPSNADACYLLGRTFLETGRWTDAIDHFNEALALKPDFELALRDLSRALFESGQKECAHQLISQGVAQFPASADFHYYQGNLHADARRFEDAVDSYGVALALRPDHAQVHANLSHALVELGRVEDAISSARRALDLQPDYLPAHDKLLWALLFLPNDASNTYLIEAKKYGVEAREHVTPFTSWHASAQAIPGATAPARLRVGLVSGDFRVHAVGFLLEGLLPELTAGSMDFLAYSMNPQDDGLTERIKGYFAQWTPISSLDDAQVAQKIHADRVNILIDLAGHTAHNRLSMFAWKPAPVQVSWLGYLASTGVPGMDFVLADAVAAPLALSEQFTEEVWHLPDTFNCFPRPVDHPRLAVVPPPVSSKGFIVFGSFQRMNKINEFVLSLWAKILLSCPGAMLRLQNAQLGSVSARTRVFDILRGFGVAPERVILVAEMPNRQDYLAAYANVDIVLDTYPYPGVTTTGEALWMGVPTVTLGGATMLQRIGVSLLTCAGLEDWIAWSEEEYVALALRRANDREGLTRLRASLRDQVAATALFDPVRFAGRFEHALVALWNSKNRTDDDDDESTKDKVPQHRSGETITESGVLGRSGLLSEATRGAQALADGDLSVATEHYRRAVQLDPENSKHLIALGFVLAERKLYVEAAPYLEAGVRADLANADGHYLLGKLALTQKNLRKAISSLRRAVVLNPGLEVALRDLGLALFQNGLAAEAKSIFLKGILLFPRSGEFHFYLGNIHAVGKEYDLAIAAYRNALQYQPDSAQSHYNLGHTLSESGRAATALLSLEHAIALDPGFADAHNLYGYVQMLQGQTGSSMASFRRAIALEPDHLAANTSLLWALSFCADDPIRDYLPEAKRYGAMVRSIAKPYSKWRNAARVGEQVLGGRGTTRLRVGFVSADFRMHPVGYFLEGVLEKLNPARLELVAYSMCQSEDALTDRIKSHFVQWTSIVDSNDADTAHSIYEDGIDILIDLAGHTGHNRLPMFAWRPAPLQISWLGYLASTGVPGIHYLLADLVSTPAECAAQFSEDIWHLPESTYCFTAPAPHPKLMVSALPALRNGYITFGSYQRLGKLTDVTLSLWGRVLNAIPQAKLRLQNSHIDNREARASLQLRLAHAGIAADRCDLRGTIDSREDHLASHSQVDIVLDTSPYPGTTTTCEALWMGVPTVTLGGNTMLGRIGASVMTSAGLPEWVAWTEEEFIALAARHAADTEGLVCLRAGLRAKVASTALFDGGRFAKHLEDALFAIWQRGDFWPARVLGPSMR